MNKIKFSGDPQDRTNLTVFLIWNEKDWAYISMAKPKLLIGTGAQKFSCIQNLWQIFFELIPNFTFCNKIKQITIKDCFQWIQNYTYRYCITSYWSSTSHLHARMRDYWRCWVSMVLLYGLCWKRRRLTKSEMQRWGCLQLGQSENDRWLVSDFQYITYQRVLEKTC